VTETDSACSFTHLIRLQETKRERESFEAEIKAV